MGRKSIRGKPARRLDTEAASGPASVSTPSLSDSQSTLSSPELRPNSYAAALTMVARNPELYRKDLTRDDKLVADEELRRRDNTWEFNDLISEHETKLLGLKAIDTSQKTLQELLIDAASCQRHIATLCRGLDNCQEEIEKTKTDRESDMQPLLGSEPDSRTGEDQQTEQDSESKINVKRRRESC